MDLVHAAVTPVLPGLASWSVGLPWLAVFILTVLGVAVSAVLAWIREAHRHDEIKTVLAHPAITPDATAIITVLRAHPPRTTRRRRNT